MTDNTKPQRPAPLDPTRLHTPAEVRKWKEAEAEWAEAIRAAERHAAQEEEAKRAYENRYLTETEYHERAIERENENRARQAEREAARFAEEQRKKEALAESPDIADVLTNSPAEMLRQVCLWAARGYVLNVDGPIVMLPPSLWHVQMKAPAKKSKAPAKESA